MDAQITTRVNRAVRVEPDQPNRKPPDPLAAEGIQPPIRFDPVTLQDTGCPNLLLLQTGPEGEAHLARHAQQVITAHLAGAVGREVIQKTRQAENYQKLLAEYTGWDDPPESPSNTYPELPLRALWELHQPGTPTDPLWLLIARGPAGKAARAKAARAALDQMRQKETHLEQATMELTPYDQVERRAQYSYQGPTLGWSLETLQVLWSQHHPDSPMPRRWHQLAPGTPLRTTEAIRKEMYHLDLYERARTLLQEAIGLPQSASTVRKKYLAAQEALNKLDRLRAFATEALRQAGIGPPPSDGHTPLPHLHTTNGRKKNARSRPSPCPPCPSHQRVPAPAPTPGRSPRPRRHPPPRPCYCPSDPTVPTTKLCE